MALGGVDAAIVPVVQLGVEERRRVAAGAFGGGRVVVDRGRDPAEQEAGLVGAGDDVGFLDVWMGGGRLAAASSVTAWPEWATASPAAARVMPSWQSNSPPAVSATQDT
jgi:hypothetical protein